VHRTETSLDREMQLHRRLERWLPKIATEAEADAVGVHLGDLYGASDKLMALIGRLPDLDAIAERDEVRSLLTFIHVELYSHMLPHMEELREGLDAWLQRLNDEVPEVEEES
jgi:hypothetical protein